MQSLKAFRFCNFVQLAAGCISVDGHKIKTSKVRRPNVFNLYPPCRMGWRGAPAQSRHSDVISEKGYVSHAEKQGTSEQSGEAAAPLKGERNLRQITRTPWQDYNGNFSFEEKGNTIYSCARRHRDRLHPWGAGKPFTCFWEIRSADKTRNESSRREMARKMRII